MQVFRKSLDASRWIGTRARWNGVSAAVVIAALVMVAGVLALTQWTMAPGPSEEPVTAAAAEDLEDLAVAATLPPASAGANLNGAIAAAPGPAGLAPIAAPMADTFEIEAPPPPVIDVAALDAFEPADATTRVPEPLSGVRGIYVNAWSAGSARRFPQLLALAERTEVNAFVIDIKDATGHVSYPSDVLLAQRIGADAEVRIPDIRGVLADLRERGIYSIARIVVFKDPLLATQRRQLAIHHVDGSIWQDQHEEIWVDPYNRTVWKYNIALAREAAALGFNEIQWDYVRFPDVPSSYMQTMVFPAQDGRTRAQAIEQFLRYSQERLAPYDVKITADVFGLTVSASSDMGIGQEWDRMKGVTDVLLPMVYPSHYGAGSYGIDRPNARPYQIIKTAMEHAIRRNADSPGAAKVRPWLQDFTLGPPDYGPAHVRAQIEAVYDAGLTSWVLWNPSSRYTTAALAPKGGPAPWFPLPGGEYAPTLVLDSLPAPHIEVLGRPLIPPPVDTIPR